MQRFREIRRTKLTEVMKGRLAQLVQSICLTSRGSAVRIRQRPPLNLLFHRKIFGRLAQLVQSICLTSRGSAVRIRQRPPLNLLFHRKIFGRLAQLVQSICLTSRGSAVRIRQRPLKEKSVSQMINGLFYYLKLYISISFPKELDFTFACQGLAAYLPFLTSSQSATDSPAESVHTK